MSSYDVVRFFFLTKFITIVVDSPSAVSRIKEEVTKEPCIAEIHKIHQQHQPCGMGALRCYVQLGILT
jgi:TusA-related sulfurtransferase